MLPPEPLDLPQFGVDDLIDAAQYHGEDSEPDHEVGDLQDHLRAMWEILSPVQRATFLAQPEVIERYEGGARSDDPDTIPQWPAAGAYPQPALSDAAASLTEEVLAAWFRERMMSGTMTLESIPALMAHYALADSGAKRQEFEERLNLKPTYLVCESWGHCFVGSHESTVRWVMDLASETVVAAQVSRSMGWESLSPSECADIQDSLVNANGLPKEAAAFDFGLSSYKMHLPEWAEPVVERDTSAPRG